MPQKRGYKKQRGKKKGKKRAYRKKGYTMKVMKGVGFIAPRLITRMKYSEEFTLSTLPTTIGVQQFRLNSVYDPNYTGAGHQPYGFDQLAALYLRYRVFATKWVIQIGPPNDVVHYSVMPINGAITISTFSQIAEYPKAMVKTSSVGSVPVYFKGKCYLPRLGGDKKVEYKSDDRFASSVTTNPTEDMRLILSQYNPSTTATTVSRIFVTLVYYTEFFDPILQAQS